MFDAEKQLGNVHSPSNLKEVQETTLLVALKTSFFLHCLAVFLFYFSPGKVSFIVVYPTLAVGFFHLFVSLYKPQMFLGSLAFFLPLGVEIFVLSTMLDWIPALAVLVMFCSILAGFLHGRTGFLTVPLALFLSTFLYGLVSYLGFVRLPSATYNFQDVTLWRSVGLFYALATGGMALVTIIFLRSIQNATRRTHSILEHLTGEMSKSEKLFHSKLLVETKIKDTQKAQSIVHLSSGIVHMVNNTLTVVKTAAERLLLAKEHQEVRQIAKSVLHVSENTALSVKQVMDFSKNQETDIREKNRVEEVIRDFKSVLRKSLPDNITLTFQLGNTAYLSVPKIRIRQVVLNLLLNARDATFAGGEVHITVGLASEVFSESEHSLAGEFEEDFVVLRVRDNGVGMNQEVALKAREPFFSTRKASGHEGLGLTVVEGIVTSAGGRLFVESSKGSGTCVTVCLPRLDSSSQERDAVVQENKKEHKNLSPSKDSRSKDNFELDEDWKSASIDRIIVFCSVAYTFALVASLFHRFLSTSTSENVLFNCAGLLVCGFAFYQREIKPFWRISPLILLSSSIAAYAIINHGFMNVSAVTGLAVTVLLAAVYTNSWFTTFVFVFTVGVFFYAPFGHGSAPWVSPFPTSLENATHIRWFFTHSLWSLVLLISSQIVVDVISETKKRFSFLETSLEKSLDVHARLDVEEASLLASQKIADRASRDKVTSAAVGSVAHDLNNALSSIIGWAQLLDDDMEPSTEEILEASKTFTTASTIAAKLVGRMASQSSDDTGVQYVLDLKEEVELCRPVFLQSLSGEKKLELNVTDGCFIKAQKLDVQRILLNLFSNSIDAIGPRGTVSIQCRLDQEKNRVMLVVQDNGEGMSFETRQKVFDAFYTTKAMEKGTGLGLYSVAKIMEKYKGDIILDSRLGEGTTVTLSFPLASIQKQDIPLPEDVSVKEKHELTILLAEDEEMVRKVLIRGLERAGYKIVAAVDGTDAIEKIESNLEFGALCTDAVMPGVSVREVISRFQSRYPEKPVILISGYLPERLASLEFEPTINFLPKPVSSGEISNLLEKQIALQ